MITEAKIQERIDFYIKEIEVFGSNKKHAQKKKVSQSILSFWNNQLSKYKKLQKNSLQ